MTSTAPHDEAAAPAFYASRLGDVAASTIRQRIRRLWPDLTGQSLLGIGYPAPFLQLWQGQAHRCLNATSCHHKPAPAGACSIEPTRLPFPDLVFDRILVVHGVEPVGHDSRLLREIWRVLKDDGRVLLVVPNRTGLWAQIDSTPFGQGQPYSRPQLNRLLASAMFRAERSDAALFTPPTNLRPILNLSGFWESAGHALASHLAGVTITEAVKDTYAALPVLAPAKRRVLLSEAA
jgi:SAM-dependent methyltransferase